MSNTFVEHDTAMIPFLFYSVGEEANGSSPTILSLLARLGKDHWGEAAAWSREPVDVAIRAPDLLILNEPLGKLDSLTRLQMQAELVRIWQDRGFTALLVTHDVEEALLLAGRVVAFSNRPAAVQADIAVDLPYPRHRDDPVLVTLRRDMLGRLGLPD